MPAQIPLIYRRLLGIYGKMGEGNIVRIFCSLPTQLAGSNGESGSYGFAGSPYSCIPDLAFLQAFTVLIFLSLFHAMHKKIERCRTAGVRSIIYTLVKWAQ